MRISDWSSDVCSSDLRRLDFSGSTSRPVTSNRLHGAEAAIQSNQIAPHARAWAVPYRSPAQPASTKRRKCSPTRKYFRNPGVLSSAMTYHGSEIASINEIGSAHVCTPVTNEHILCRLLL